MRAALARWAVSLVYDLLAAYLIMLGVGRWHAASHTIPTIGFWPTLFIVWGIDAAIAGTLFINRVVTENY